MAAREARVCVAIYHGALLLVRHPASASSARICSPIRRYALRSYTRNLGKDRSDDMRAQWSGADYVDNLMKTVTGGISSTAAMGKGVTETQFTKTKL